MDLPKVIADLIAAQDKFNSKAFADTFADDAVVHDERKTYRGRAEIKRWNEMTNAKYKTKYEPLEVTTKETTIMVKARISGTFDGSPAIINYRFETDEGKIKSLQIT